MYKKLKVWHLAMDLVLDIYEIAEQFPKTEEYNLKSQLKRAIVSVPLNIAEGKTRNSSKDFGHFLNIAIASLAEVEVVLQLAERLNYITDIKDINNKIENVSKMLNSLRTKLLKD